MPVSRIGGPALNATKHPDSPFFETGSEALEEAKRPWQVRQEGRAEKECLFETVLAKGLLPFKIARRELILLPLKIAEGRFTLSSPTDLLGDGKPYTAKWVQDVESIWEARRSSEERSLFQRLNYNNILTNQDPAKEVVVIYNKSGTNLTAALFLRSISSTILGCKTNGLVVDHVTYYHYPKSIAEGDYLCAILNSDVVNQLIKAYQPEGLYGERDIHRRPFEVCSIPPFNPIEELHGKLSGLGEECRMLMEAKTYNFQGRLGSVRLAVKKILGRQLAEINQAVSQLLKDQGGNISQPAKKTKTDQQDLLF